MKQGTTATIKVKLDVKNVEEIIFTFANSREFKTTPLLQKTYPSEVELIDGEYHIGLTQTDTNKLSETFYLEAQCNLTGNAVVKSLISKVRMPHTLATKMLGSSASNGEEVDVELETESVVEVSSDDYEDLTNKPSINSITLVGNKTSADLNLQDKLTAGQNITIEDNVISATGGGASYSGGNGIDITNNVVSVDLAENSNLGFISGKLYVDQTELARQTWFREKLADTSVNYALASKTYVDGLMSGAIKWEFVSQLPTENIDIHTIYFVPKESAETDNIYNEWVYALQSRNPDVYDWELLGTSQVDLSNYYTKTESDNKYPLKSETYSKAETNTLLATKVDKIETALTEIELQGVVKTETIDVSNYATLYVEQYTLTHSEQIYIYPIIDGTEQASVEVISMGEQYSKSVDISAYDGIKFLLSAGSGTTRKIKYKLSNEVVRERELTTKLADKQDKLTFTNGLAESSGTVGIDLASGSKLLIDANDKLDVDLSSKQDTIDSSHKLSADNVDDTSTTNKFVPTVASADYGKYLHNNNGTLEWSSVSGGSYSGGDGIDITNDTISVDLKSGTELQITSGELDIDLSNYATTTSVSGKQDKTDITTDTTSTTVSLTLADNHEYRYTQELTSLTLTMPSGDFIASIVFASGSTPTSMTYDSSIKWSGDDVTGGQFVPSADKDYDIMMYYNGLNVNGIVRGV